MFCVKCGAKLNENAKFCTLCGTPQQKKQNEDKAKPLLSHRLGGVILIGVSLPLCFLFIVALAVGEKGLVFPALIGVIGIVFGISLKRGSIMNIETVKKQSHYKKQTESICQRNKMKFEREIEIPVVDAYSLNMGEKKPNSCFISAVMILVSIALVAFTFSSITSNTRETSNTPTENVTNGDAPPVVDLSAYQGDCEVTANVDIEKDTNSHWLDVNIVVENVGEKDISKLTLYFVKCYNKEGALKNSQNCERLNFEDISARETTHKRWVLGTTDAGALEYKVFVAYVLYADGTEWGKEKIDHATVVTRAVEADVCYYEDGVAKGAEMVEKEYVVTYSARLVSNSHVGDSWSYGMEYGDETIRSGQQISAKVVANRGVKLTIFAVEYDDDSDDYGAKDVVVPNIEIGETISLTEQVMVTEDKGRYTGHNAYIKFQINVERIS